MSALLAIAAPQFNAPSVTFIRNHVRTIAPGSTILMSSAVDGGADQFGCPALSGIDPWPPAATWRQRLHHSLRFRWRRYLHPGLGRRERRRVRAFLELHRPKALLAEYGPTGCLVARACREAGVPLFVHFHGFDANIYPRSRFSKMHYKALFSTAEKVIVTTEFLKSRLLHLQCPEEKLAVCPCGVDTRRFAPAANRNPSKAVLMVARLTPQKGPLLSINAFAKALREHPEATLEIVGDGPLRLDAEAEATRLGIRDRVVFHGAQNHDFVLSRLQNSRMLIQHCVTIPGGGVESLGLSILEAMACQLPVVATRHGAIPETVTDGQTGILVDERDVDGMANAIAELLDDPVRAKAMGEAGRQKVIGEYALEHSRDQLRSILGFSGFAQVEEQVA